MSYTNPAFDNFPREEAIIGRMILAFGELEYLMVTIAGTVNGDLAAILKALYRLRSTTSRLDAADALIRPFMAEKGADGDYSVALGALRYCHTIRNTYAHCNWASHGDSGLFYADLEDAA